MAAPAQAQGPRAAQPGQYSQYHRRSGRVPNHILELSQCLLDFVVQLLPSKEEVSVKEDVRKLLERLIKTIEPSAQLLSFGSTANGFELKNSDMDLCCILDPRPDPPASASQFVLRAAQLLERETKFAVKPLPNARIPIIKLSLQPSPSIPFGIACDIGFENRLALENTRLLFTYAAIDPIRVRTLVLFLKLWSKRRKINSPYHGTLSSYGYALLVIFFLVHVKDPPVLPNLQQMPPMRPISPSDTHINGRNVWFFDDIELLRRKWQSPNTDTIGELLLDFFRYFSREFSYGSCVASIRAGHLSKESFENNKPHDPREGTSLWIEDPFETSFNVGRCVTRDGLYTIRGEFMRAVRILSIKQEVIVSLASLCEERDEEVPRSASQRNSYNHPRYNSDSVGPASRSQSANGSPVIPRLGLSPVPNKSTEAFQPKFAPSTPVTITAPGSASASSGYVSPPGLGPSQSPFIPAVLPPTMVPPPHMAPQRGKWTSPPPEHAPPQRHNSFNERLASGIKMAVSHPATERTTLPRYSPGSSITDPDEEAEDLLEELGAGETRSSSPASSMGLSIQEFKPRNKPPIRVSSSDDQVQTPTSISTSSQPSASTSTPKSRPPPGNGSQPHWRHSQNYNTESSSKSYNGNGVGNGVGSLPVSIGSLPTLKIPTHPFYYPGLGTSPNGTPWMDCNFTTHFGMTSNPPRSPHSYTPYRDQPPHRENSHRDYTPREGVRPGRNGSKSYSPNTPFQVNARSTYANQGVTGVTVTPQQLPTPPVSSPYSGLQLASSSPSPPMLLLEEPSASAR